MENQTNLLYDWVSFTTTKFLKVSDVIRFLGLEDVEWDSRGHGAYGYEKRTWFNCISIHYSHKSGSNSIWVDMSGQGCRAYESFGKGNFQYIFDEIRDNPDYYNLTRLDVACDDINGSLEMSKIAKATRKEYFVSKFKAYQVIEGSGGVTVVHGSPSSEILIRIYDKKAERQNENKDIKTWVRCELQLRRERAVEFINLSRQNNVDKETGEIDEIIGLGEVYFGVLNNYLRYVDLNKSDLTHKYRWETSLWWDIFLKHTRKCKLFKPGVEYNIKNNSNFVLGQAGQAISTFIKIHGREAFDKKIDDITIRNKKYTDLIKNSKDYKYLSNCGLSKWFNTQDCANLARKAFYRLNSKPIDLDAIKLSYELDNNFDGYLQKLREDYIKSKENERNEIKGLIDKIFPDNE